MDLALTAWPPPVVPPRSSPPGRGDRQVEVRKFVVISLTIGLVQEQRWGQRAKVTPL